ncbi:MAG: DNA-3-methyladenine glycosylase I [Ignavibacteria bacterium]
MTRCPWSLSGNELMKYHDKKWGVPVHSNWKWFEFVLLDVFQAGLSWNIVLKKRNNIKAAFSNFNPNKIARYTDFYIERLLVDSRIIRNRVKITAAITNARAFLRIRKEVGSFDEYIWSFTNGKVIHNKWEKQNNIPTHSPLSDKISKDLKQRGFCFVGTTICYAFLQAGGIINDHIKSCFRYKELKNLSKSK